MCHANECMYVLKCINMNIIFLYVAWMEKKNANNNKKKKEKLKNQINYKTKEGKRIRMIFVWVYRCIGVLFHGASVYMLI